MRTEKFSSLAQAQDRRTDACTSFVALSARLVSTLDRLPSPIWSARQLRQKPLQRRQNSPAFADGPRMSAPADQRCARSSVVPVAPAIAEYVTPYCVASSIASCTASVVGRTNSRRRASCSRWVLREIPVTSSPCPFALHTALAWGGCWFVVVVTAAVGSIDAALFTRSLTTIKRL